MVEEKTARELKKLLGTLVDHSHGHHKAIHGLIKRVQQLERRVRELERRTASKKPRFLPRRTSQ
jgi:hypothetical protein